MQFCNFEMEEFLEVEKGDIIKAFSHVIYASRVIGVNNFNRLALTLVCVGAVEFSHAETFRDFRAFKGSISINSHSANMNEMTFSIEFHNGNENVFGGESVVGVCVVHSLDGFHGVGCGSLLC